MYVFLKSFSIGPIDSITSQTGGASDTSNSRKVTIGMHLFISCVNLLTGFFVFVFLVCFGCMKQTDVFLYLVLKAVVMLLFLFYFSNRDLSLMLYFYEVRGTIEQQIML